MHQLVWAVNRFFRRRFLVDTKRENNLNRKKVNHYFKNIFRLTNLMVIVIIPDKD